MSFVVEYVAAYLFAKHYRVAVGVEQIVLKLERKAKALAIAVEGFYDVACGLLP